MERQKMKHRRQLGLRQGMLGIILLCWVLPVVLIVTLGGVYILDSMTRQYRSDMMRSAQSAAAITGRTLDSMIAASRKASYIATMGNAWASYTKTGDYVTFYNEMQTFLTQQYRYDDKFRNTIVTLVDDPLLEGGMGSRPFDDEGVPSATHTVVEDGVFRTFLHNLKTARKDGVATTGNARKVGYASAVHVTPTNFYLKPGKRTLDDMLRGIGEGLVITEVSGLHAGANPISGDFSLLAKGYTFREGRREKPVEQITVAGNFYELLEAVRELASDLTFPMGGIGCPSVDVGELSVSGT